MLLQAVSQAAPLAEAEAPCRAEVWALHVQEQALLLAQAVREAIACRCTGNVEVRRGHDEGSNLGYSSFSLTVVAELKSEHFQHLDGLLKEAQEVLLRGGAGASPASGGSWGAVAVLHQMRLPFRRTPQGFSAILTDMPDRSQACWDAYGTGFCQRGVTCRWRHPRVAIPFQVVVQLAEPSISASVDGHGGERLLDYLIDRPRATSQDTTTEEHSDE